MSKNWDSNLKKYLLRAVLKIYQMSTKKLTNHAQSQNVVDIHVHALFSAVEHGQVEKTKTILESSDVNVNSMNSDGLSPLDVAVLSNNKPLIKVLISYGAQDGRKFYSAEDLRSHLMHLLHESERRVHELGSSLRINDVEQPFSSSSSNNIPAITVGDSVQCKTFSLWERRTKGLRNMLLGLEQIRPPDMPNFVNVEVTSATSIMVYFQESDNKDSSTSTKFRVQWSLHKDFSTINGHFEMTDPRQLCYHMTNLKRGHCYYIRVSCGNLKGYSPYKTSTPHGVVPSSWNDISSKDVRSPNAARIILEDVFNAVVNPHPYLKNTPEIFGAGGELLGNPRRKKTTIKQLFTAASKFQKHLRRGVYLSCLLYHEDKVLVTNEDFLPVIEVDETFPKKINADFHWFFKVASCWSDLKWLKNDIEKSQNSSIVFRIKLLQAATQMQTALSIQELGKLYHKLIKDSEGTIVISIINYIRSPKSVSVLNLRWLPLAKLIKRTNMMNMTESNVGDLLMSSIPDQITYHQVSNIRLPRGLYLGYLKMRSSMESLQILVPSRAPNIPPHCKIRDNPHVTAEEWEWLTKKENLKESLSNASYHQRLFIEQVAITTRRLFTYMEISSDEATYHRLYDVEVIEISKDVSLIMVLPPTEAACSIPGQLEMLLQRPDLLPLTVQVFEMVHFGTYQHDLVTLYSRLSCIIEMDIDLAQHSLRKAFSSAEVNTAKTRLSDLENLQSQLNSAWKLTRWLLDVISYARDRLSSTSVNSNSIQCLLSIQLNKRTFAPNESRCFLQPPESKTAKSRGSWPGVGVGRHLGRMPTEMSRSEQQLTSDSMNPPQATATPAVACLKTLNNSQQQSSSQSQFSLQENEATTNRTAPTGSEDIRIQLPVDLTSSKFPPNTQEMNDTVPFDPSSNVAEIEESITVPVPTPAIVQVFAAYNTGLPCGTSLKLHVSPKTSAREIVELFVKQLNMSVLLKGKEGPVYPTDQFPKFCLVAVIGARERCLRDDFKLLQLQEPWKDGRLYVRRKSDVLAAIEHSSKQASTFV